MPQDASRQLSRRPKPKKVAQDFFLMHIHGIQNQTTYLGLEGTDGLGRSGLSDTGLLGLDRSGTTTLQTPGGGGSSHDGGGDRKGEANDGQGELHDSILQGQKKLWKHVCILLVQTLSISDAMETAVSVRHRYAVGAERKKSSGDEKLKYDD